VFDCAEPVVQRTVKSCALFLYPIYLRERAVDKNIYKKLLMDESGFF
jgi:hypothetical protein